MSLHEALNCSTPTGISMNPGWIRLKQMLGLLGEFPQSLVKEVKFAKRYFNDEGLWYFSVDCVESWGLCKRTPTTRSWWLWDHNCGLTPEGWPFAGGHYHSRRLPAGSIDHWPQEAMLRYRTVTASLAQRRRLISDPLVNFYRLNYNDTTQLIFYVICVAHFPCHGRYFRLYQALSWIALLQDSAA